ncbi:2Fe-2S iron-sulfur cluster-binding protein [Halomarina salina]|uniref:2Fe-2S iron-sulfur cluster-binding protein n=1 Tax=Halomarina salina TaxID=1872699 RepID=A0ABD5RMK9_9EURY|nr:2Fe-2S iron-sulfur cluster-binding protein [Halomarina salina]
MSSDPIWESTRRNETDQPQIGQTLATGTATDPDVGSTETATVTVDGQPVTLDEGSVLLDALERVETDAEVSALCSYDHEERIGPRSECRTCMVETEEDGLVPSCSYPAEDGATVRTDSGGATEARDVNLDLVLSDHNLLCTTCGQNGRCELQDASIEADVEDPRYGVNHDRETYEPVDVSSPFIQIDRNKCILCNRCVEACNDVQVAGVLRVEGHGEDTRIGFQNGAEEMMESTCVSCGHCATVCPTGAIVEEGLVDMGTIPVPGFTQANSIGETVGEDFTERPRRMTSMFSEEKTENTPVVEAHTDHVWEEEADD